MGRSEGNPDSGSTIERRNERRKSWNSTGKPRISSENIKRTRKQTRQRMKQRYFKMRRIGRQTLKKNGLDPVIQIRTTTDIYSKFTLTLGGTVIRT